MASVAKSRAVPAYTPRQNSSRDVPEDEWLDMTPPEPVRTTPPAPRIETTSTQANAIDEGWIDVTYGNPLVGEVPPDVYDPATLSYERNRMALARINRNPVGVERGDPVQRGVGAFTEGGAEQLGVHPSQWEETAAQFNPVQQVGRGLSALSEGRYSEVVPRLVQGLLGPVGGAVVPAIEHLASDPYEEIQAARDADSLSKAIGHGAAAMVPLFGKQAADIGELAATEPTRAAGRATSLLLSLLVGGSRKGANVAGEKPQFPAGEIRQTYSERTGKLVGVSDLVERSFVGSGPFRRHRLAALGDVERLADRTVERISSFKGTPEQLGNVITKEIEASRKIHSAETRKLSAEVDRIATPKRRRMNVRDKEGNVLEPEPGKEGLEYVNPKHAGKSGAVADPATGAWVDTSSWQPVLEKLRKVADDPHRTFTEPQLAELRTITAELKGNPRLLPWDTAQRTAAAIRKFVRDDVDISPTAVSEAGQRMSRTLDASMQQALETLGGKELAEKWRAAQQLENENRAVYLDGVLSKLEKQKPESAHKLLVSDALSLDDVRVMTDRIGKQRVRAMAAQNLRDAIADSITPVREGGKVIQVIEPHHLATRVGKMLADGKLGLAVADPALEAQLVKLVNEVGAMKDVRGINTNALDPGNRMLNVAQALKGEPGGLVPGVIGLTGLHKFLLSPDPWLAMRNALSKPGLAATPLAVATRPDEADTARRSKQNQATTAQRGSIQ